MKEEISLSARFNKQYSRHSTEIDKRYKARQVAFIKWADKRYLKGNSKTLLDIGCGNGLLLSMLNHSYQSKGLDVSKEDIALAKQKVRGVGFITANMLNFELKERFDIITCFDAIDHGDDLRKGIIRTLSNLHRHLEDEGILIFSMALAKDTWFNEQMITTVLSVKKEKWISMSHKCIRNKELNFDRITLLLKNGKTYQEFKTSVLKFKYDLLETEKICDITNKLGFKTFIYGDWSGNVWNKNSKEQPIFVCVK